ncbi:MAG: class I SAM-dependent methyltransferase [Elusimicrobia bacterium]|nr:class I SAM-dependent methyltransferase [Elusimicrobiota bacterium]
MRTTRPSKKLTFGFFEHKWRKAPQWAQATKKIYRAWYLKRYGYHAAAGLRRFLRDKTRILEAGCGGARDSEFFAECNGSAEIVAMDQSPSALKVASRTLRRFKNCRVVRADITKFRGQGSFDFISCDQVLHHTPDPAATLRHFYRSLSPGGVLSFSVCRKKNPRRDLVDDLIMERARSLSHKQLWRLAAASTSLGKVLHELKIGDVRFGGRKYADIQRFIHDQVFRCWYSPDVDFALSMSSNYDWFSGNPRFSASELRRMMRRGLGPHKVLRFYEDDATISVSIRK